MPTTPISGLNYPLNTQSPNAPAQMADFLGTIDSRLIPRFTNATFRDAAIPFPAKGQLCYLLDVRHFMIYRDSQWRKITIPVTRITTTPFSSINDTTLDVVTELSIPMVSGKKYRVTGVLFFNTPAADYVDAKVRITAPASSVGGLACNFLELAATQKNGIYYRRTFLASGVTQQVGVVSDTYGSPFVFDGVYAAGSSGNLTFEVAQDTLSAVELRLEVGSYVMINEF